MDLYAISLVEHCANLLSTNGTAVQVTDFFSLVLFAALLVFILQSHSWLLFHDDFYIYDKPWENGIWSSFFLRVRIWLPFSPNLICLPAVCFVSCTSSLIALTQSFNHASSLSTLRSQGGSLKIKSEYCAEQQLPKLDWESNDILSKTAVCFLFQREDWFVVQSVTQYMNGCSVSLKWDSLSSALIAASQQPNFGIFILTFLPCWNTKNVNRGILLFWKWHLKFGLQGKSTKSGSPQHWWASRKQEGILS